MQILALYLPQFHETKENNEWWGKGFTEWTAVKNAKPLFLGHEQPVKPLNGNYYNLLDYDTMNWQSNLMKKYNIDGLCIYHYWFKDGRRILEKPAENLLKWKDLDIKFCFSWANETWARTWSRLNERNTWASLFETAQEDEKGILLQQKYGDKLDWEEHFEYLLQFFKDDRYIKINKKPVVMFHRLREIYCFENMIDLWNELAQKNGFNGIYVIGNQPRESQMNMVDLKYICEPGEAMQKLEPKRVNNIRCYDYEKVWEKTISENQSRSTIGGFVRYDDTPRHGNNGSVLLNANPDIFKKYIGILKKKNIDNKCDFMFINAWNEWGEGMYLEPDNQTKFDYLEGLSCTINDSEDEFIEKDNSESSVGVEKYNALYEAYTREIQLRKMLDDWISVIKNKDRLFSYIDKLGTIAVYGYGMLGKRFVQELLENGREVKYIIDRYEVDNNYNVKTIRPNEYFETVDTIVVTPFIDYGTIYSLIREKNHNIEVVSIEYIIEELLI